MKQEYVDSGKWKKIGDSAVKSKSDRLKKHKLSDQSDESPPRKIKYSEGNDVPSPPRKRQSSDESPPRIISSTRKSRRDSDQSPPRRQSDKPETSIRRRDASPEKIRNRKDSSDISPPRKARLSPQVKIERRDSPPRRSRNSPRRERRSRWSPEVKRESKTRATSPPASSKMTKTLDGKAAGLQDANTLKRENDAFKERQEKLFNEMRPEMSGRDAEIVVRDRRGRNKAFESEVEDERRKAEADEVRKREYDRWGKGLKQIEDLEKRYKEHMHEASKPLARMADDEDLQDHLRHQERLDDPMLEYMRKKKDDESRKKGVEVKPKYLGQFPDNRFNIRPGYRWDGVDRSNGYEKKYFSMINSKKSQEEEAYRYSTEDM